MYKNKKTDANATVIFELVLLIWTQGSNPTHILTAVVAQLTFEETNPLKMLEVFETDCFKKQ